MKPNKREKVSASDIMEAISFNYQKHNYFASDKELVHALWEFETWDRYEEDISLDYLDFDNLTLYNWIADIVQANQEELAYKRRQEMFDAFFASVEEEYYRTEHYSDYYYYSNYEDHFDSEDWDVLNSPDFGDDLEDEPLEFSWFPKSRSGIDVY